MIHHAVSHVAMAKVGVLLQAGADETALETSCKRTAIECVGKAQEGADRVLGFSEKKPKEVAAVRRMLGRGSAHRARSWGWLVEQAAAATAAGPAAAAAATAATMPLSSSRPTAAVGVRIFRPESTKFYVRLILR